MMGWVYGVALIPLGLILVFRGWNATFRSGEAFLFLAGLTFAVWSENLLSLISEGFFRHPDGRRQLPASAPALFTYYLYSVFFFGLGIYYTVHQPHVKSATTSWIQVVLFFYAMAALPYVRFAFTKDDLVSQMFALVSQMFAKHRRGVEDGEQAESPPAPVLPAPVLPAPVLPAPVLPAPVLPAPVLPGRPWLSDTRRCAG
jgi:hypothetical protein